MNAIEEGGKVARSIVGGLKGQPLALALVVINLVFVGAMVFTLREALERETNLMARTVNQCLDIALRVPPRD